jgi:hypothetical protein
MLQRLPGPAALDKDADLFRSARWGELIEAGEEAGER